MGKIRSSPMLGYTREDVENMATTLNYTLHHHIKDTKFADEDKKVLRKIEDLLLGLLIEGRV
jgi:exopolyphosphatase/pppGpp-phosphohydrolase